jgi:hypothetical protein
MTIVRMQEGDTMILAQSKRCEHRVLGISKDGIGRLALIEGEKEMGYLVFRPHPRIPVACCLHLRSGQLNSIGHFLGTLANKYFIIDESEIDEPCTVRLAHHIAGLSVTL